MTPRVLPRVQQKADALCAYKSHCPGVNSMTRCKASNGQRAGRVYARLSSSAEHDSTSGRWRWHLAMPIVASSSRRYTQKLICNGRRPKHARPRSTKRIGPSLWDGISDIPVRASNMIVMSAGAHAPVLATDCQKTRRLLSAYGAPLAGLYPAPPGVFLPEYRYRYSSPGSPRFTGTGWKHVHIHTL